jgi:hypothetical protein
MDKGNEPQALATFNSWKVSIPSHYADTMKEHHNCSDKTPP